MTGRDSPISIVLSAVRWRNNPAQNLLSAPVIVAHIILIPVMKANPNNIIYQTTTSELRIEGIGFVGIRNPISLYFYPPLKNGIVYEDISQYPLENNEVVLRLKVGQSWRKDPGLLLVLSVDTGGGIVKQNGENGVSVALVQVSWNPSYVSVDDTAKRQMLYTTDTELIISGSGFNTAGTTLKFANGLLGNGVNYTTIIFNTTTMMLRLVPGGRWRPNNGNSVGPLVLFAVNAGRGFVTVGPTNSDRGRYIATIFEYPEVFAAKTKLYHARPCKLTIKGSGFPLTTSSFRLLLRFHPPLEERIDYMIRWVTSKTSIDVELMDTRNWRAVAGMLYVVGINTRGDEGGWIMFPGEGIPVAEVVEDPEETVRTSN
jgi:hypothetical protein